MPSDMMAAVEGSGTVDAGVPTAIVATARDGYRFEGWTGDGIADSNMSETTITVNSDSAVTASFVKVLVLNVTATDGGSAQGGGTVDMGTEVPIMATQSEGYRFDRWVGDGIADATAAETTITVNSDTQAMASFVKVWNVNVSGSEGGTAEGSGIYDDEAIVPIAAMASDGYRFGEWIGDGIEDRSLSETTVIASADAAVTAKGSTTSHTAAGSTIHLKTP